MARAAPVPGPGRGHTENGVARGDRVSKAATLESFGLTKQEAHVCERIAAIPEKRFEEEVRKPEATTRTLARIGGEYRGGDRAPQRRSEPAPVSCPPVSGRVIEQRMRMFRARVEGLTRKQIARWPTGTSTAPLAQVLVEIANSITEA